MAASVSPSTAFPGPVSVPTSNLTATGIASNGVDNRKKKRPAPKPNQQVQTGSGSVPVPGTSQRPLSSSSNSDIDVTRNALADGSRGRVNPRASNSRTRSLPLSDRRDNIRASNSLNVLPTSLSAGDSSGSTSAGNRNVPLSSVGNTETESSRTTRLQTVSAAVAASGSSQASNSEMTQTVSYPNSHNASSDSLSNQSSSNSNRNSASPVTSSQNVGTSPGVSSELPVIFRPVQVQNNLPPRHRWSTSSEYAVGVDDQRRLLSSSISLDILRDPSASGIRPPTQTRSSPTEHRSSRPVSNTDILPDILNSHIPPPYERRRHRREPRANGPTSPRRTHRSDRHRHSRGNRSRHRRNHRRSRRTSSRSSQTNLDEEKKCCSAASCRSCIESVTRFRWVLVSLALLGLCCITTGVVLGAMHESGSSFIMLAPMFAGLGILLVIVVIVGWRCTPRDHEPCHLLFGLGVFSNDTSVTDLERGQHERRERTPHWFGGVLYPEFRYRRPPPSYNASMHDYQQQMMAAAELQTSPAPDGSLPNSPPPTYRSQASVRPGIHITFPASDEYPSSRPPTYRSHLGTVGTGAHSRPPLVINNTQPSTGPSSSDNHQTNANTTLQNNSVTNAATQNTSSSHNSTLTVPGNSTLPANTNEAAETTQAVNSNQVTVHSIIVDATPTTSAATTTEAASTPSSASEDHIVRLTLTGSVADRSKSGQSESSTDIAQTENVEVVIGESTMHRGLRLVESLENMLDESLRSMDDEPADVNNDMTAL